MKRTKQVILARGLAVGVPTAFPHKLVDESGPLVPDRFEILGSTTHGDEQSLFGPSAGYDIAASPAAVVITRLTVAVSPDIEILCSRSGLFGPGEYLGALDTGGYKTTTGVLKIPPRDNLHVRVLVRSYGPPGTVGLVFNGDTGANYVTRFLVAAAGGAVLANVEEPGQSLLHAAGADTTRGRSVVYEINNFKTAEKLATITTLTGTGSAATPPDLHWGGGSWVNTSDQITSIELVEDGGQLFDAALMVWGRNAA